MIYSVGIVLGGMIYLYFKIENLYIKDVKRFSFLLMYFLVSIFIFMNTKDDINGSIYLIVLTLLTMSVVMDIRDKLLPVEYYLAVIPLIILKGLLIPQSFFNRDLVFDLITIAVLLVIGYIFRHSLGFGDILVFVMLTVLLGFEACIAILLIALVLTSLVGLGMIGFNRASRRTEIPFSPFILIGFIAYIFF